MHIHPCVINDLLFFSKSVAAAYRRPAPAPPAIAAPPSQYQQEYHPQYRTQYQRQYQPAAAAPAQYRQQYNPNKYPGLGSYSVNYRRWKGEWQSRIRTFFFLFWVSPLWYTLDERLLFVHRLRSLIYAFAHVSCGSIEKLLNNRLLDFRLFANQKFW